MTLFSWSGLLIAITSFIFALLVFLKGKKNLGNRLWALFCVTVGIWGVGAYKIGMTVDANTAIFWWRFTHIGVIFIPVIFWHYVYIFLEIKKRTTVFLIYAIGFIFLFFDLFC